MNVQEFIYRARGRYSQAHQQSRDKIVTVIAMLPISITVPEAKIENGEWDELTKELDTELAGWIDRIEKAKADVGVHDTTQGDAAR